MYLFGVARIHGFTTPFGPNVPSMTQRYGKFRCPPDKLAQALGLQHVFAFDWRDP